MARTLLMAGLYFIGISAVLIAGFIAIFGISAVGAVFGAILDPILGSGPLTDLGTPNDDSELRFYSVFFAAYGAVLIHVARHFDAFFRYIPHLLCLFFLGGVARLLGYIFVGQPHALFSLLMGIELILPLILIMAWRIERARRNEI